MLSTYASCYARTTHLESRLLDQMDIPNLLTRLAFVDYWHEIKREILQPNGSPDLLLVLEP
jgi:hypothetical protein